MESAGKLAPSSGVPRAPCTLVQALGRGARKPQQQTTGKAGGGGNAKKPQQQQTSGGGVVLGLSVLLILGGVAAALLALAGLVATTSHRGTVVAPIREPDLGKCHAPDIPATANDTACCLPYRSGTGITDFRSPLRVRPAAHLADDAYLAKYERAVALMRELPDDDPRSFVQQARAHCAYCDGAYDQAGFPGLDLQIHQSWLFFPWHRWYLYFHERILGKLIGDDTFALPFWNWDAPSGMTLPAFYTNESSPLYDEKRDPAHLPPSLVDLNFCNDDDYPEMAREEQVDHNLELIYRQMISGAKKKELFFGQPYSAGDEPHPGGGAVERGHGTVHAWVGDPRQPNGEDMGPFYSAARDPVFFAHHGNVDRLWDVWRGLSPGNTDFTDADWLHSAFLFYDEDARLVRVRVRDCLDAATLRYAYQDVDLPWLNAKPATTTLSSRTTTPVPAATGGALFPVKLDRTVTVAVTRPRVLRSQKEKAEEEEVLVVDGIEIAADHLAYVKFDVFVNQQRGAAAAAECAGSVALPPHAVRTGPGGGGITELLGAIGADGDETLAVSIVPRCGGGLVTVSGVRITYVK